MTSSSAVAARERPSDASSAAAAAPTMDHHSVDPAATAAAKKDTVSDTPQSGEASAASEPTAALGTPTAATESAAPPHSEQASTAESHKENGQRYLPSLFTTPQSQAQDQSSSHTQTQESASAPASAPASSSIPETPPVAAIVATSSDNNNKTASDGTTKQIIAAPSSEQNDDEKVCAKPEDAGGVADASAPLAFPPAATETSTSAPPPASTPTSLQSPAQVKKEGSQPPSAGNMNSSAANFGAVSLDYLAAFAQTWRNQPANYMSLMTPDPKNHHRPSTVTPSQMHVDSAPPPSLMTNNATLPPGNALVRQRKRFESFARIKFADGDFQMNTYSVIIGRDRAAIRQAQRDEKRAELHRLKTEENMRLGLPPPAPLSQEHKFSKSYISEEGGMLGPESSGGEDEDGPPTKRQKTNSAESSAAPEKQDQGQAGERARQYVSHTPGAAAVDWESLRPSPDHVAFIGIHSPGPDIVNKSKGISRNHLQITYNKSSGVFEAIPLHHNGFFHQDVHRGIGSVVTLRSGDRLQIKDIDFSFYINGVELGCTGAEEVSKEKRIGGRNGMSFDFEPRSNGLAQDTSEEGEDGEEDDDDDDELSDVEEPDIDISMLSAVSPPIAGAAGKDSEDRSMEDVADAEMSMVSADGTTRTSLPLSSHHAVVEDGNLSMADVPRKRGPGRPPKNGIMSKRQQRELKKAEQEIARQQAAAQVPPVEPPAKRKVGRPRKHPLPEGGSSGSGGGGGGGGDSLGEKRKYKPRKPKGEEDGEGGTVISDPERPVKEKKGKVVRPKSPALDLRREDYTEQQLQKPNKNYGVLIDETLSVAPEGLTLKQIYKRISQRYPWFYFHTETKGWESSVRHNLIGNEAFKKEEVTNLWKRVPGVELDAGKRRKATSPDHNLVAAQTYGAHHHQHPHHQHHLGFTYAQQQMAHAGIPPHQAYQPGAPHQQIPQGFQMPNYNNNLQQQQQQQQQQKQHPLPHQQPPPQKFPPPSVSPPHAVGPTPQQQQPPRPQHPASFTNPQLPAPARPNTTPSYNSPFPQQQRPQQTVRASPAIKSEDANAVRQSPQQAAAPPPQPLATGSSASPAPRPAAPPAAPPQAQTPAPPAVAASSPPAKPTPPLIEPFLLSRLNNLRVSLADGLKRANTPHAHDIVWSAMDRVVGIKKDPSGLNNNLEDTCYGGMNNLIQRTVSQIRRTPTPDTTSTNGGSAASASAAQKPLLLRSEVSRHLQGLRNQCVDAIKQKLPENDAVALVHSAIMRTLGLATESRLASRSATFDSLERAIMRNVGQVINQMAQQQHNQSRRESVPAQ